jgi:hypothetical protein
MESHSAHLPLGVPFLDKHLCHAAGNTEPTLLFPFLQASMSRENLTGEGTKEKCIENVLHPVLHCRSCTPARRMVSTVDQF